jgi:3-oxoacyl-[acyl-carrier-protein] synthase III
VSGPARISGIGLYLPPARVDNYPAAARLGIDKRLLEDKIGVLSRAVKNAGERTSDLCVHAFTDLLRQVPELVPGQVDLLCVVTQNPDQKIPHTAAIIHQRLGLAAGCMTFDLSQGCAGYVHGLAVVMALVERLGLKNAVLITCDPYSTIVDPTDRDTSLLFGDAATATYLSTDTAGYRLVDADFGTVPGSAGVLRCVERFEMRGREVFLHAVREVPRSIRRVLDRNDLSDDDVDVFLLHPGSLDVIKTMRSTLGLDEKRLPFEAETYGNTVSSSIPPVLKEWLPRKPARVVLSGFGVGFTWGSGLLETQPEGVTP